MLFLIIDNSGSCDDNESIDWNELHESGFGDEDALLLNDVIEDGGMDDDIPHENVEHIQSASGAKFLIICCAITCDSAALLLCFMNNYEVYILQFVHFRKVGK